MNEFVAFTEGLGHTSDAQRARFLNVGQATMSRLRSGHQNPGPHFIAAVYRAVAEAPGDHTGAEFFEFDGGDA